MREIHECTAEVFRRSEKRIKDRKRNRNRVLFLCVPACLLVTALSAWVLPKTISVMKGQNDAVELASDVDGGGYTCGMAQDTVGDGSDIWASQDVAGDDGDAVMSDAESESIACPYTAVEIRNAGLSSSDSGKVTDQAAVTNLFNAVYSLFADVEWVYETSAEEILSDIQDSDAREEPAPELAGSTGGRDGYAIIFTADTGDQAVYHLNGNTLLNDSTNEMVVLNDAQVAELLAVFGILE